MRDARRVQCDGKAGSPLRLRRETCSRCHHHGRCQRQDRAVRLAQGPALLTRGALPKHNALTIGNAIARAMTEMQQGRILIELRNFALGLTLSVGSACIGGGCGARAGDGEWRAVPRDAVFETGDTWRVGSERYRLYGVQACLRGMVYTGQDGRKRDCGDASLTMATGLIRALSPSCAPVARRSEVSTYFVVCYADMVSPHGNRRVDLGTALIASGFAFAALDAIGRPVNTAYAVAEAQAKTAKAGLWTAPDLPYPNIVLLKALHAAPGGTP